jgi:hypothetical protein
LEGQWTLARGVIFSPDGSTIAAISGLGGIGHFWPAPSFAEIKAIEKAQHKEQ